jgi:imidazole glycerol phosphate synthase subunit HisF
VLTRRFIACLDVRDGRVVKGVRFRDHVDAGGIEELALRYSADGADELVFYDIGASPAGRGVELAWIARVQELGAGEIVLNCMGVDGVRAGYDLEQLRAARAACALPLVASGGAGAAAHFAEVFEQADVDAALAASIFHSGALGIGALKQELRSRGLAVRT